MDFTKEWKNGAEKNEESGFNACSMQASQPVHNKVITANKV